MNEVERERSDYLQHAAGRVLRAGVTEGGCAKCDYHQREKAVRGLSLYRCWNPDAYTTNPHTGEPAALIEGAVVYQPVPAEWNSEKLYIDPPKWCPFRRAQASGA